MINQNFENLFGKKHRDPKKEKIEQFHMDIASSIQKVTEDVMLSICRSLKNEYKINNFVKEDHEISYQWITNDELEQQPELVRTMSVQPPKIKGKIRLVKIGNIDLQPCGGTHVKSTAEIGEIKIGKIENKGKMNRRVNLLIND